MDNLSALYSELQHIESMDEETACNTYNVDFKHEAVNAIKEEIASCEREIEERKAYRNREVNYYRTADNPYLCW